MPLGYIVFDSPAAAIAAAFPGSTRYFPETRKAHTGRMGQYEKIDIINQTLFLLHSFRRPFGLGNSLLEILLRNYYR